MLMWGTRKRDSNVFWGGTTKQDPQNVLNIEELTVKLGTCEMSKLSTKSTEDAKHCSTF